jgi:hypothetical protein
MRKPTGLPSRLVTEMMLQVEIFQTGVRQECEARGLVQLLSQRFPGYGINFDLDDCDHILRVESGQPVDIEAIIQFMIMQGYTCACLT